MASDPLSPGQRNSAIAAVIALAAAVLWTLHAFLAPVGWAAIVAMALWPVYSRLGARWPGHDRLLLPALTVSLVTLVFVVPLAMIANAVVADSAALVSWFQQAQEHGLAVPAPLAALPFGDKLVDWWNQNLSQPGGLARVAALSPADGSSLITTGEHMLGEISRRTLMVLFMLLTLFFLLRDGEHLGRAMHVATKRAFGEGGERVFDQAVAAVRGTVSGLTVIGFVEAALIGLVYSLAGVPHAALLSLLTGLLSAIPLGAVVAYVLAAALLYAGGESGWAMAVLIWGSVVVFVADHFVRPVMIGESTRLPFLAVLLGIIGGIEVWGLIGIVLGPALLAVALLLWREWVGEQAGPLAPE